MNFVAVKYNITMGRLAGARDLLGKGRDERPAIFAAERLLA